MLIKHLSVAKVALRPLEPVHALREGGGDVCCFYKKEMICFD